MPENSPVETFLGTAKLAAQSTEGVAVLRERVTSKGGTTSARVASLETDRVQNLIVRALHAANQRAHELGEPIGRGTNDGLSANVDHRA